MEQRHPQNINQICFRNGAVDPCLYTKETIGTIYLLSFIDDITEGTIKFINQYFQANDLDDKKN